MSGCDGRSATISRHGTRPRDASRFFYGWIIVAVAFVVFMISYGLRYSFSIFFPSILQEFKWSRASTAGIFSLHLISYGLISPLSGRLADKFGPRRVIPVGAFIMGVGMITCSASTELWHFYLLYGIVVPLGVCVSGWSQFVPTLTRWFVRRRATALGLASAGFALSFLLSSLTAPLILYIGWRGTFVFLGLLPIVIIAPLAAMFLRGKPEDIGVLPDGDTQAGEDDNREQYRSDHTISQALGDYRFWLMFLAFFLVWGIGQSTIITHQIAYIRDIGYTEAVGAVILALYGVIEVLGNLSSSLADRFRREIIFVLGSIGLCFSVVVLMMVGGQKSGPWVLYGYAAIFGFFNGLVGPVLSAIPADLYQGRNFGSINGLLMLGFGLGGAFGPWLGGFLFDLSGTYLYMFYLVLCSFSTASVMVLLASWPLRKSNV